MFPVRLIAACVAILAVIPARADSLVSALTDAYQLNQQIAAERAAVQGKDELVPEAQSNLWRPHVIFQPQYGGTWTSESVKDTITPVNRRIPRQTYVQNNDNNATDRLLQLNVTMNIFDSGLTAAQLRQAKALIDAERAILKQTEEQVFQNAATQYGQIVLNQLLAQYALETKQDTGNLRGTVKSLQEQHFATLTSVTQVEEEYQSAIASYEQAAGAARAARAQFAAVVGRQPGKIDRWPRLDPIPAVLEDGLRVADDENPQLLSARSALVAAYAAVDYAKAQLLPVFSLYGTLSHDWNNTHFLANNTAIPSGLPPYFSNTDNAASTVGVRMTMPLYQGGGEYAAVRQQLDSVLQNRRTVTDAEFSVRASVESAWQNLEAARAQYRAASAQTAASRLSVAGMKRQFADGTETITDVLTEERNLSSALAAEAQVEYTYFISVVAYEVAVGRFTAKDLNLPVKLYDPLDHYKNVKNKLIGFSSE